MAFPVPGSPIPLLNRHMGCPKLVQREDGRQPHVGEENLTWQEILPAIPH